MKNDAKIKQNMAVRKIMVNIQMNKTVNKKCSIYKKTSGKLIICKL